MPPKSDMQRQVPKRVVTCTLDVARHVTSGCPTVLDAAAAPPTNSQPRTNRNKYCKPNTSCPRPRNATVRSILPPPLFRSEGHGDSAHQEDLPFCPKRLETTTTKNCQRPPAAWYVERLTKKVSTTVEMTHAGCRPRSGPSSSTPTPQLPGRTPFFSFSSFVGSSNS
ncbi:hypothetical protein CGRA01v4_05017 [Colletotrichum graminicola]|nr:hypothetical protein CGRA01v4_05017 [Colletotrichum graminicola]